MPDLTTPKATDLLTPAVLATIAEAVGTALAAKQSPTDVGEAAVQDAAAVVASAVAPTAPAKATPAQLGTALGDMLAPMAAPLLARSTHRLASRKLWTMAGTMVTLLVANAPAINLPPIAQVCLAAVGAIYVAAQAIVDSAAKGGGK